MSSRHRGHDFSALAGSQISSFAEILQRTLGERMNAFANDLAWLCVTPHHVDNYRVVRCDSGYVKCMPERLAWFRVSLLHANNYRTLRYDCEQTECMAQRPRVNYLERIRQVKSGHGAE